ncbi:D-glycero-alpha-D-manno-heptose-7-phosphate kinase [Thermosporothrix hazakensis]|jgi:D-glycero-alpha-D-manno-heptose-7-phosphate kinase|uniref:D-glycero-alpha-D-manno-heptose-7-phosphate kinase n=2 Tax=Thermosporothrix TaxID=768650 RepID=A0A326UE31_THEHA|nr:GHMP kinase [Thermosporothrix hazakensis]PZW36738.1 D-glycero-alpha-D-manno-heptose-7-phosphate kinase [Thermosporothrix hazakensis]BBH89206.1 GHMP kinase [Thermosporothrix sp. COM3]GCE47388.1 GHMP kinase [Thermosporothrix hazakensis]
MLLVRAPMRISFGGGGTDLEAYYGRFGGVVISTAINKYFYTIIEAAATDELQIISADYRSLFRHAPFDALSWDGDLALPKAVCHHFGIRGGLNLFLAGEVPPGTGLGSSSSAAVALVRAFSTLLELPMSKQQVAELASSIEIEKMGMPIGKQDQYASAFGGLNKISFTADGVTVTPLQIARETYWTLERRLLLFFTGRSRLSTSILKQQRTSTEQNDVMVLQALHHIKEGALQMQECLESGDLERFARLLHYAWQEKRCLAPGLSSSFIDECYELALQRGALGGKITGAGGGGFLLLYCPEEAQEAVTLALEQQGLQRMNFRFDRQGAAVILNVSSGYDHLRVQPYEHE